MRPANNLFSVVVCTYNRSKMLRGCLDSLCNQSLDKKLFEIIVVDNASTDDTPHVVEEFSPHGNIRYILETRQGLSYARNRGLLESHGKFIAYIDDDARAAPDLLDVASGVIKNLEPGVDCLGGPCHPFYTSPKPEWFLDRYEKRGFGDTSRYLLASEYISGSNMIWAKEILDRVGGFDVNAGVKGDYLRLGEETHAFQKLWELNRNAKVYFSPELIIYHWVPEHKMKVTYRLKRKFTEGQYFADHMETVTSFHKFLLILDLTFQALKTSLRFLVKFHSHSHWENWIFEDGGRVAFHFGKISGVLGFHPLFAR